MLRSLICNIKTTRLFSEGTIRWFCYGGATCLKVHTRSSKMMHALSGFRCTDRSKRIGTVKLLRWNCFNVHIAWRPRQRALEIRKTKIDSVHWSRFRWLNCSHIESLLMVLRKRHSWDVFHAKSNKAAVQNGRSPTSSNKTTLDNINSHCIFSRGLYEDPKSLSC